jgi:ABC-type branched-subunit amino acid transport system ATPase component
MLLRVEAITAGYVGQDILHEVDMYLEAGAISCIIGPNGAGKSTLMRAVVGQIFPSSGSIFFDGKDVTASTMLERAGMGMVFVPQGTNIFPNLTVLENLEIGTSLLADASKRKRGIEEVLERFPFLRAKRKRSAGILSGGERQMLALSRIIVLRPLLGLLDEPSLGLSPIMVETIFDEILAMNRSGTSMLLVEQNARKALSISHIGYVLELGRNRLTGTGEQLLSNPEVRRLYLGG